jgi:hypothetical protein
MLKTLFAFATFHCLTFAQAEPKLVKLPISQVEIDIAPLATVREVGPEALVAWVRGQGVEVVAMGVPLEQGDVPLPSDLGTFDWGFVGTAPEVSAVYERLLANSSEFRVGLSSGPVRAMFIPPLWAKVCREAADRPFNDKPVIVVTALGDPDAIRTEWVRYLIWQNRKKTQSPFRIEQDLHQSYKKLATLKERITRTSGKLDLRSVSALEDGTEILKLEESLFVHRGEELDVSYVTAMLAPEVPVLSSAANRPQFLEYRAWQCRALAKQTEENRSLAEQLQRTVDLEERRERRRDDGGRRRIKRHALDIDDNELRSLHRFFQHAAHALEFESIATEKAIQP